MFRMLLSALVMLVAASRGASSEPVKPNPADRMRVVWADVSINEGRLSGIVRETEFKDYTVRVVRNGKTEEVSRKVAVNTARRASWDCSLKEIVALDCGERIDSSLLPSLLKEQRRVLIVSGANVNFEILKPIQRLILVLPASKADY